MPEKSHKELLELVHRFEEESVQGHTPYLDADEFEQIAEYYQLRGKAQKALQVIQLGLKIHQNNDSLTIRKVELYLLLNQIDTASNLLNSLPQDDNDVCMLRAAILLKQHHEKEALALLHEQIKKDPQKDLVCLDAANMLITEGFQTEALPILEIGLSFHPENADLYYRAADCCTNADQKVSYLQRLLDEKPYHFEAWHELAQLYISEERYEEAATAYDFAVVTLPKISKQLRREWGAALLAAGRSDEAIVQLKIALEEFTSDSNKCKICRYIAQSYQKKKEDEQSIFWYKKALEYKDPDEESYLGLGVCYLMMEKWDESFFYLNEVTTRLNPSSSEAWSFIGDLYEFKGDAPMAIHAYEASLAIEDDAEVYFSLANVYFQQKDYQQALVYYLQAEREDSSINNLYLLQAISYSKCGQAKEAAKALSLALDQDVSAKLIFDKLIQED